jgi:hypothetical protein
LNGYLEIFDEDFIECPLCDEKTERPMHAGKLKKNIYLQLNETEIGVSCIDIFNVLNKSYQVS